jgi:hypothetical protein
VDVSELALWCASRLVRGSAGDERYGREVRADWKAYQAHFFRVSV